MPDPDSFILSGMSGLEQLEGAGVEQQVGKPISALPYWYINGQPKPSDGRITFSTWKHYQKNDPLIQSGLVGPVIIITGIIKEIN
jgi:hypothetical protein